MKYKNTMVEIWGDVVEIKDLIVSIILSSIFIMGAYFFIPTGDKTRELFYGLLGAVLGFIVSIILIKPKRIVIFEEDKTKDKE